MYSDFIDWDDEAEPLGNTRHVAEHGVTREEFEQVLDAIDPDDVEESRSDPTHDTAVGETAGGRTLRLVFEVTDDGGFIMIRPITAYDPEPGGG